MKVSTEHGADVLSEAESIQHGEQLQQSGVVRVREPGLDGDGIVCRGGHTCTLYLNIHHFKRKAGNKVNYVQ